LVTEDKSLVAALIVTYHPSRIQLEALLAAISQQVEYILIVDNTEALAEGECGALPGLAQRYGATLVQLGQNRGIAVAQNHGLAILAAMPNLEYILFLDHDSLPADGMVQKLVDAFVAQNKAGHRVAAVGPQTIVPKLEIAIPFLQIAWFNTRRIVCSGTAQLIRTDHLISSGTLVSKSVLSDVGLFRDDLFIDYVDVEWYLRAIEKGYTLWGVCAAKMQHDLGDEPIRIFGRTLFAHSPLRHYYLVRNAIALYRSPTIPLRWKCSDAFRLIKKSLFYLAFGKPRWAHLRWMSKGAIDGFLGRMGKQGEYSASISTRRLQ
jgi:rhamnosyltransferase